MMRALSGVFLALLMIPPALAQTTGTPADHEALSRLKADAVAAVNQRDYTVAQRILHRPFMASLITQDSFSDFDALNDYFESLYTLFPWPPPPRPRAPPRKILRGPADRPSPPPAAGQPSR